MTTPFFRFLVVLVIAFSPLLALAAEGAPRPPNIVFILADDLGWRDLGCTGSTFYETPNLDRLAKQGVLFSSAYAACPVCSPSRAAIMTGCYPVRTGVTDYLGSPAKGKLLPAPYARQLPPGMNTLPQLLGKAGYVSWHVGKWHLGNGDARPQYRGFTATFGGEAGSKSYFSPYNNPDLPDGPPGEYLTDRLTDEAIKFIRQRDPNKPFYLNLWHHAPHVPIQAPEPLVQKYREKARKLGLDQQNALVEGEHFPTDNKNNRHITRRIIQSDPTYAGMIESLDTNVGRLLQTLDELHLADDTIVVFTSDNGGLATAEGSPTCNLPLRDGKGWLHEGGVRVPLIVRWPGVTTAGSAVAAPVDSVDFLPTFLDAAGSAIPDGIDGRSLKPLLAGSAPSLSRDALYWHYPHYGNQGGTPGSSVRMGPWKLIEYFEDKHLELYNLDADPNESKNLADSEPERAKAMQSQLARWRDSVEAKYPTPNPDHASSR